MIDILKAKIAFKEYAKNYDLEDKKIKLKIAHMERTSKIAREIAKDLELSEEDIGLAELIGLLHDIGRFKQIEKYHTFNDRKSVNHAECGVKVLFEEGKIRDFIETDKYDEIIKTAILNHNRNYIEEGLDARKLVHAKIIRDADKTDILYILTFDEIKTIYETDNMQKEKISDEIYREYIEDREIDYGQRKSAADSSVGHFAYIFDFNFTYGLKYIEKNQYLDKFYNRFKDFEDEKTKERYEKIYKLAKEYIREKIDEG